LIEGLGFDSGQGRENFTLSVASILPFWLTQPLVQRVPGLVSFFLILPPPGAGVKYALVHTSCPHMFLVYC